REGFAWRRCSTRRSVEQHPPRRGGGRASLLDAGRAAQALVAWRSHRRKALPWSGSGSKVTDRWRFQRRPERTFPLPEARATMNQSAGDLPPPAPVAPPHATWVRWRILAILLAFSFMSWFTWVSMPVAYHERIQSERDNS